jgi:DNA-binding FadR family transcriptional regulator
MATAGTPAYEQLAARLREQIASGELSEGDRLPSETKLAELCGVSRSTVRESLRTLEQAGLIARASPKVMVVRQRVDPPYREVAHVLHSRNVTFADLHEALLVLEPEVTRLATERCDASDIRALHEMLGAQERSLDQFQEWSRLDQEFHLAIAEMSSNPALIVARAPITKLLMPALRGFMTKRSLTEHATRYHHRIVYEIEARDPELAAAITRRHVNDFRVAWEKAGLDVELAVADIAAPEQVS